MTKAWTHTCIVIHDLYAFQSEVLLRTSAVKKEQNYVIRIQLDFRPPDQSGGWQSKKKRA